MGVIEGWGGGTAAELVASMHVDEDGPAMALRVAREGTARLERAERAAELERQAEAEEKHEAMLLRYAQMGLGPHSLSDVFASASRAGDEDAELADAQKTIARIERRRLARQETARLEAEQVAAVQRADSTDMLAPAKAAHGEYLKASRAVWSAARAGTPRRRSPFAGAVARSELVDCPHCKAVGASPSESFLIHSDPQPPKAPAIPSEDERMWLDSREAQAERRSPRRRYAEISR